MKLGRPFIPEGQHIEEGFYELLPDPEPKQPKRIINAHELPGFREAYSMRLEDRPDCCGTCVFKDSVPYEGVDFCGHPLARGPKFWNDGPWIQEHHLCDRFLRMKHVRDAYWHGKRAIARHQADERHPDKPWLYSREWFEPVPKGGCSHAQKRGQPRAAQALCELPLLEGGRDRAGTRSP